MTRQLELVRWILNEHHLEIRIGLLDDGEMVWRACLSSSSLLIARKRKRLTGIDTYLEHSHLLLLICLGNRPYPTTSSRCKNRQYVTKLIHVLSQNILLHMSNNIAISDNRLITEVVDELNIRLPRSWRTEIDFELPNEGWVADARLRIYAPDGTQAILTLEAKRRVDPRDVEATANQLTQYSQLDDGRWATPVLVAPFLSMRTRERLEENQISYMDLTGNIRIAVDNPPLFVQSMGALRSPWREERPVRSLKGAKAGRIVRALCDFSPPFGVRQLANIVQTDPGYVSRLLAFLEREDLIERQSRGPVTDVRWQELIRRWTEDFSVLESNRISSYLEPRGLNSLLEKLGDINLRYAVTGSLGSANVALVAPSRLAICYVDDPESAAKDLGLRSVESGANVILAEPFDSVVYERAWEQEGVTFAALSQIAADLLTSPGRGPAEANELLDWMARNEAAWRS